MKKTEKVCLYCGEAVYLDQKNNRLIHEHGYIYTMECPDCDWKGGQPAMPLTFATDICPKCKVQGKLRDNHVINPCTTEHYKKYREEMAL